MHGFLPRRSPPRFRVHPGGSPAKEMLFVGAISNDNMKTVI
jgi:hypothetical protein